MGDDRIRLVKVGRVCEVNRIAVVPHVFNKDVAIWQATVTVAAEYYVIIIRLVGRSDDFPRSRFYDFDVFAAVETNSVQGVVNVEYEIRVNNK